MRSAHDQPRRDMLRGFYASAAAMDCGFFLIMTAMPFKVLALGAPAKVVRKLRPDELRMLAFSAREYRALAAKHARTSRVLFGV